MNNLDKQYTALLQDILDNGVEKKDRTGTGTISVFGRQIRHKMSEGFPLLTTKKMYMKGIITELLWFLRGDTNIKYLVDNDCHIWDGDAYKNFKSKTYPQSSGLNEFDKEDFIIAIKNGDYSEYNLGDLGPIYGKQWRNWKETKFNIQKYDGPGTFNGKMEYTDLHLTNIDQIANLINDLKTNPDSRRIMVNAWNVGEIEQMVLPPCHYGFQIYTRKLTTEEQYKNYPELLKVYNDKAKAVKNQEYAIAANYRAIEKELLSRIPELPTRAISLMWNQRSVDTFLGLPFNIASYGLLLEIIAKEVNMVPDELIGNLGDTHLYLNHIEQAKEQIGRELTLEERKKLYENEFTPGMEVKNDEWLESKLTTREIPKRTREPYPLPKLNIFEPAIGKEISILNNLYIWSPDCFIIENYQSHPTIKAPLSN